MRWTRICNFTQVNLKKSLILQESSQSCNMCGYHGLKTTKYRLEAPFIPSYVNFIDPNSKWTAFIFASTIDIGFAFGLIFHKKDSQGISMNIWQAVDLIKSQRLKRSTSSRANSRTKISALLPSNSKRHRYYKKV